MAKQIVDLSGMGGLPPRHYGDIIFSATNSELRYIGEKNQLTGGSYNPFAKLGFCSPANGTFTAVTGGTDAVMGASIIDTVNLKGYFYERGTAFWELDGYADVAAASKRSVASSTGCDLEIYQVNGVRKFFYAYKTSTSYNIGIWDFSATYNDTWLSGTVSGAFTPSAAAEVKLVVADNGFMYVLDNNKVHKIDGTAQGGTNGTIYQDALAFPAYFQCVDAVDIRGKMWIATIKSTRNIISSSDAVYDDFFGVYIWNRQTTTFDQQDFIPIDGIRELRAIFSFRGIVHCITVSSTGFTQLRAYNGSEFKVIKKLGKNDFPIYKDSVKVVEDQITWITNDGKIYIYGKIDPSMQDGLYHIGTAAAAGGALLMMGENGSGSGGDNTTPEVYYLSLTTPILKKWYPHARNPNTNTQNPASGSTPKTLAIPLPKLSTVKSVTLFFPPLSSSGSTESMYLDIYLNMSSTTWGQTVLTRDDGVRGWKFVLVGQNNVNFIQLGLSWNASSGIAFAITPSYAEIEYEPSTKAR